MKQYLIFIPNLLSLLRIVLAYPILISFYNQDFLIALSLFLLAAFTDALDGFLARTMNWKTDLGKILDPIADKVMLVGLILVFWLSNKIPNALFYLLISRDLIILLGAAFHMTVYNVSTPIPNFLGKISTAVQMLYLTLIFIEFVFKPYLNISWLEIVVGAVCLMSLVSYAINWISLTRRLHSNES
tara:strand:- start:2939 stop:3496 length:558 start_codon:yes stop_codon:yes gene_type:complete